MILSKLNHSLYKLKILFKATVNYWLYRFYVNSIVRLFTSARRREALPGDKTISIKWLTSLLRQHKLIDNSTNVAAITIQDLSGNRGLVSAINIIKIEYDKPTDQSNRPNTLILKHSRLNFAARCATLATGQCRESLFFNKYSNNDNFKHLLPNIYYTYASKFTGCYLIIMENVCDDSEFSDYTIGCNFYFGNQIWGGLDKYKHILTGFNNVDLLNKIFENAARIHAKYWNDKSLLSKNNNWLKSAGWYMGKNRDSWELAIKAGYNAWNKGKLLHKDNVKWSSKLIEIIDNSYKHTSWSNLQLHLNDPNLPFTLTHGDFHASNMLYNTKLNRLIWVDWSEVGVWEPLTDIGQLIISDINIEARRANENKLIINYYKNLIENGVDSSVFTFEMCLEQYKRSTIERWVFLFSVLSSFNIPAVAVQYFHDQLSEFINDHHSSTDNYYILKPVVSIL